MGVLQAIANYIEQARSRIYGIFVFWVVVLHTPIIFTAIFTDQNLIYQKTHLLKGEYIVDTFYGSLEWWGLILYVLGVLGFSGFMTWLMIWVLPKTLIKKAYGRELDDLYDREFMKVKKDEQLNSMKSSLINSQKKVIEEEEAVAKKQEDLESREEKLWLREYGNFKKSNLFQEFDLIPRAIYEYYGNISVEGFNGSMEFEVPYDLVAYADSAGLIQVDTSDKRITGLTDKGRYFYSLYQIDKKSSSKVPF